MSIRKRRLEQWLVQGPLPAGAQFSGGGQCVGTRALRLRRAQGVVVFEVELLEVDCGGRPWRGKLSDQGTARLEGTIPSTPR